jgi:hypothetical protein
MRFEGSVDNREDVGAVSQAIMERIQVLALESERRMVDRLSPV